jgi:hypothetical protein
MNSKPTDLAPPGRSPAQPAFQLGMAFVLLALLLAGCACPGPAGPGAAAPADRFRVSLEARVQDSTFQLVILKIEARSAEMAQLQGEEGSARKAVALSRAETGAAREGRVILAAMLVANEPLQTGARYQAYQALESRGARATRRGLHELGPSSTLETDFTVTVTNGTFPQDRPLIIGTCNGQPIELTVGRWN